MEKNTVAAKDQFHGTPNTDFHNPYGKGVRVLFIGNSITLHGIYHEIGWHWRHGMAASSPEKDYVHIIMDRIKATDPDAAFCVCNVAKWEVGYKNGDSHFAICDGAKAFGADVIVMRFIENVKKQEFDGCLFKSELKKLFDYIDPQHRAKVIMSTGFWKHPGDEFIREYASENSLPLVELGDLGQLDEMKAIGLFDHPGVANHPGDLGMEAIAHRIWDVWKEYI